MPHRGVFRPAAQHFTPLYKTVDPIDESGDILKYVKKDRQLYLNHKNEDKSPTFTPYMRRSDDKPVQGGTGAFRSESQKVRMKRFLSQI